MTPNPLEQSTPSLILGISGLRGIVGVNFGPDDAERFARAIAARTWERFNAANLAGIPRVVLSRDGRANGCEIHARVGRTLASCGCDVIDLDIATTPTTGVMTDRLRAHAGVIITASHNPDKWNGIKCLVSDLVSDIISEKDITASACAPNAVQAQQLIDIYNSDRGAPDREGGSCTLAIDLHTHSKLVLDRIEHLTDIAKCTKTTKNPVNMSCVLDSVNASGWPVSEALLDELHCTTVQIAGDSSGVFPHEPEPTKENLTGLCARVKQEHADIGFAQDPDADRLAIIDEQGTYIGEEYTLVLCALSVLSALPDNQSRGATLCTNLSTSRMIEDVAAKFGARVVRTAVGEANVVETMKRTNAVIGGEGNGGVIWPEITYVRDSLAAMALVISLMRRTENTLSHLVGSIPSYAIVKRKLPLARKDLASPAIDALASHWRSIPDAHVDTQDGVRIDVTLDDGSKAWVHVRASNTEPILRLIGEARTIEQTEALLEHTNAIISATDPT